MKNILFILFLFLIIYLRILNFNQISNEVSMVILSLSVTIYSMVDFFIWKYFKSYIHSLFLRFFKWEEYIRFSIAYLFKIKLNGKYLLIKGNRIDHYQPIGGVFKIYPSATKVLEDLGVKDDKNIPIDETNKNDLRVRVPIKNTIPFIKWFDSRKDREISVSREFYEELIKPNFFNESVFPYINSKYLKTNPLQITYSTHFKCWVSTNKQGKSST